MTRFAPAGGDVTAIVADVREKYHGPSLADAEVSVVMAEGGDLPPATLRAVPVPVRAAGGPDLVLTISRAAWDDLSHPGRVALADHALSLGSVRRTPLNGVKLDGAGRPACRKRRPDLGDIGFGEVLRRHKARSLENARLIALNAAVGPRPTPTAGTPQAKPQTPQAKAGAPRLHKPAKPTGPSPSA